jgi:hypothetical protein
MSRNKYENGASYYEITRKIEAFIDKHFLLDSKQEKEENLRDMLLYTMEFPEYINYYDSMREAILENIHSNYKILARNEEFLTACEEWLEMFDDN